MNDIEKIRSLAKAVQDATTKQEKSIAISDLHDSLNSQVVLDILDRLEAVEKSDAESISMYRKARDEREALRAEVIYWKEQKEPGAAGWRAIAHKVKEENEALRVKLEEIEKERRACWRNADESDS